VTVQRRALARFRRNRGAVVGAAIVVGLVLFAIVAPIATTHDPLASDFAHAISPSMGPLGPGWDRLFGADRIYRDVFARVAYGARLSLLIGCAATAIATVIGAVVGMIAGYFEGAIDGVLMRLVDVGMAFPFLLLVMAIGASLDRITAATILVTLGLTGWLGTARIVRSKTLQVKRLDFVEAARALGARWPWILLRHVLPNVAGPLVVIASLSVAQMILAESVLGYLGAGIAPPTPTWGRMLYEAQGYIDVAPWMLIAPGSAIVLAAVGFNLVGEGVRDALDPKDA
jgi:ABC-type dipeptide/oligopeptide/nickel transport system permease subunit